MCDRLWIVQDGRVETFLGTYSEYAEKRRALEARLQAQQAGRQAAGGAAGAEDRAGPVDQGALRRARAEEARRRRQQQARIAAVEQEIEKWEAEKRSLEEALADPELYADGRRARETVQAHQHALETLERLMDEWAALQEALES